ncbi:hypothetical protein MiSe_82140 [Microseira wollei NIES-4236]|uniref:Uncharacterized protein n=1 Tax=Microseira wollei NIES-4236 TaxID=2530354 RepID=A0AAV3XR13_9CYAN|nr:hypothetical protein MiSe_82140 [Microseira wollei NIES-4236]
MEDFREFERSNRLYTMPDAASNSEPTPHIQPVWGSEKFTGKSLSCFIEYFPLHQAPRSATRLVECGTFGRFYPTHPL